MNVEYCWYPNYGREVANGTFATILEAQQDAENDDCKAYRIATVCHISAVSYALAHTKNIIGDMNERAYDDYGFEQDVFSVSDDGMKELFRLVSCWAEQYVSEYGWVADEDVVEVSDESK